MQNEKDQNSYYVVNEHWLVQAHDPAAAIGIVLESFSIVSINNTCRLAAIHEIEQENFYYSKPMS